MAENKPINWAYPFPCKETNSNSLQLLTHMAKARGGYYPTGENGLWHGGVHFDDGTAAVFDQSSVRCIADGEVIAYRIDERYPVSEFTDEIPRIKRAPFSTGFVLVKHTLQPPQPKKAEGDAADEQMPPSLTLYSLYMHLQDWAGYQAKADLPRPAFWEVKSHIVNTQSGGLGVRANPDVNSPRLSELSKGAEITVSAAEGELVKLASLINGTANPPLTADSEGNLPGYISSKFLQARSEPKELGQVVVLDAGIPIKAGELIGHPGTYQNHNSSAHPLVHLEVFSCDDVPGFIAQSRAWANRLPDEQKTLLKVYKGASKLIAHRDDINANNPPKLSDSGSQIGVDLIVPQALLDGLPAANKIQVKTPVEGSPTPNTTYWWRLEGLFADENGNPIDGWLAEQELITTRHSPWEWQDFQWLEDTGMPLEKLAYTFNARGMLSADEQHNYRAHISKADGGPIVALARLYDIVDTDEDGVLTSDEIRAALAKPWHAQVLGQLITKYESEWFWNEGKWDELDPLLAEEPGKPNSIWEVEKQRIEKLSWWSELAGQHGISGGGLPWSINAMSLIGGFVVTSKSLITMEMLKLANSRIPTEYCETILPLLNKYAKSFEVNTKLRIAHFLAQVGHESGFRVTEENLSYSAKRMREVFGCRNNIRGYDSDADECLILPRLRPKLWSEESKYARNARNLGSYVYADREGNGNEESEEGYKYRGRGIIQLTGKRNYRRYTEIHNSRNPTDPRDFVESPDLIIENIDYGIESAFVWWDMNNLNSRIESSYRTRAESNIREHVRDVSKIVNGGDNGLDERVEIFNKLREMAE